MPKGLATHALLAALASVLAYAAWKKPKSVEDQRIVVFDGSPADLKLLTFDEEKHRVEITPVQSTYEVSVLKKDAEPATTQTFPPSKRLKELLDGLLPLLAVRQLGNLRDLELEKFGLQNSKTSLKLKVSSTEYNMTIGNGAYGSGDLYARRSDGEVFLIANQTLANLRFGAASLTERNLLLVDKETLHRVHIRSATLDADYLYRRGEGDNPGFYAALEAPETKLDPVTSWMEKILRLRVVATTEIEPPTPAPLSVEFFDATERVAELRLWPPAESHAVAHSTYFKTPVQVSKSSVEVVFKELDLLKP